MDSRVVEGLPAVLAAHIDMNRGEVLLQLILGDGVDTLRTLDVLSVRVVNLHVALLVEGVAESGDVLAAAGGRQVSSVRLHVCIVLHSFFVRDGTELFPARRAHLLRKVAVDHALEHPRCQGPFVHGFVTL